MKWPVNAINNRVVANLVLRTPRYALIITWKRLSITESWSVKKIAG